MSVVSPPTPKIGLPATIIGLAAGVILTGIGTTPKPRRRS